MKHKTELQSNRSDDQPGAAKAQGRSPEETTSDEVGYDSAAKPLIAFVVVFILVVLYGYYS